MKFLLYLFSGFVLSTVAVGAPLTAERQIRQKSRRLARSEARISNREGHPPYKPGTSEILHLNASSHPQYSSNWAGAVLIGTGYTSVTAEFTVPTPRTPPGGSHNGLYCASAWVGIDGDTCTSAILQTGIDFCVQGDSTTYSAWYEWYPDFAYDFGGISLSPGDVLRATVNASSTTSGTATVQNLSKGQTVSHTFDGNVYGTLCEYNAEWIVEDFSLNGGLVPFVDFGTVTFTGAQATSGGSVFGPSGAALIEILQKHKILTSSSVTDSSVSVSYQQ